MFAIEVSDIRKTFRGGLFGTRVEALRGVSAQVEQGEIFGILGPNGAGKTTLIKILLGIVKKTGGSASLLGKPAGNRSARKSIGYLPENHRIPLHHTAATALLYYGNLSGVPSRIIRSKTDQLLESVGLKQWRNQSVRKFSKGMLQRLGLAQALLHDPELLVLDEPTDGLDPEARRDVRVLLKQLKEAGKTVFINSHLLQEVELVCDRVVILKEGQVLRMGTVDELTRAEEAIAFELIGEPAAIEQVVDTFQAVFDLSVQLVHEDGVSKANLRLNQQSDIDEAVDRFRAAGISISSMHRDTSTLEEAFLDVVKGTGE